MTVRFGQHSIEGGGDADPEHVAEDFCAQWHDVQPQAGRARGHVAQQEQHRRAVIEAEGNAGASDAEAWNRPETEDQQRRDRDRHDRADQRHQRRDLDVAGAAQCGGLEIDDPDRNRACEEIAGIGDGRVKRAGAAAERPKQRRAAKVHPQREQRAGDDRKHDGVEQCRIRIVATAGADRARYRGGDAGAETAIRHHRHQHEDREHQRGAGQRVGAEIADVIGLGDVHGGLCHQHGHGRCRELEQGRQDRRGQKRGATLVGGRCHRARRSRTPRRGLDHGQGRCGDVLD